MSKQKLHVSAKEECKTPHRRRRKEKTDHEANCGDCTPEVDKPERRTHHRHRRKDRDASPNSSDVKRHRHKKRHKPRPEPGLHPSDIAILKQKLREIEELRVKIEELQFSLSNNDVNNSTPTPKVDNKPKTISCFGFLNKKSKPEMIQLYGDSSKLSYNAKEYNAKETTSDEGCNAKKTSRRGKKDKFGLERKENAHDLTGQHRITNNNTIVLPESYGVSQQQSAEQVLMSSLSQKLETQVEEIKEIKDTLKECINLLRRNGAMDVSRQNYAGFQTQLILDEYIKLNRVLPNNCNNFFPTTYKQETLLNRCFEQHATLQDLQTANAQTVGQTMHCDYLDDGKGVVMKVSPLSRCHMPKQKRKAPPKSVTQSLSELPSVKKKRRMMQKMRKASSKRRSVAFKKSDTIETYEYDVETCKERGRMSLFFRKFVRFICCRY